MFVTYTNFSIQFNVNAAFREKDWRYLDQPQTYHGCTLLVRTTVESQFPNRGLHGSYDDGSGVRKGSVEVKYDDLSLVHINMSLITLLRSARLADVP